MKKISLRKTEIIQVTFSIYNTINLEIGNKRINQIKKSKAFEKNGKNYFWQYRKKQILGQQRNKNCTCRLLREKN